MAKKRLCGTCANYAPGNQKRSDPAGSCALIGEAKDTERQAPDRIYSWDYEDYRSGVYVGSEFGCIHHKEKVHG
jgi:hypothetical protein